MRKDPKKVDWDDVYERNRRIWLGLDNPDNSTPQKSKTSDRDTAVQKENENYNMHTTNDIENDLDNSDKPEEPINTLKGIPFLPKNLGTPKNVIPQWYDRHHKGFAFRSSDCFFSWNDNGKAHEMHWTSIFKCPVTGELFGSGKFGDDKSSYKVRRERKNGDGDIVEDGQEKVSEFGGCAGKKVAIVWHRKKKDAEHAAAARALDCLSFRDGGGVLSMCYGLCEEDPYLDEPEEMDDDDDNDNDDCDNEDGDDSDRKVVKKFHIPSSVPPTFFDWLVDENGLPMQTAKD